MPKVKEEKEEVISPNNQLGDILKEHKNEHFNFQERIDWKISTGTLLLDTAVGGYLSPSLLRVCGDNNEGKTPETLEILRNFLNTVPNSKGFWMIAEGRGLSRENVERCGLKFVYNYEDWNVGTVFVLESNIYELFIKCLKSLVRENPNQFKYCFIVDSIDGLQLRNDSEKDIEENNKVAGAPALSKKMLQNLSLGMFKYGHLMILISQVTAEIKLDQYSKAPNRGGNFSGGNSLLHGSDWIFEFQRTYNGDIILDNPNGKLNDGKSKPIGKWAKVIVQKSALEASRKQMIQYPIKFGKKPCGVWIEQEIIDMMKMFDLLKQKGAWFSVASSIREELAKNKLVLDEQYQGEPNFRKALEESPEITKFLFNHFKTMLSK